MKKRYFISTFLLGIFVASISLFIISCNSQAEANTEEAETTNPLIGEWQLMYAELIFPDTTIRFDSSMYFSIYMIGDGYFNFFYGTPDKKNLFAAGRGSYLLEGSKYIENVEFHSTPYIIGTSVVFDTKVEGDVWMHEGYLPVREEDEFLYPYAKGKPTYRIREFRRRVPTPQF